MAGQLGLDPPTMTLCDGGTTSELEKALENSEAVAKCFNCSISTSAIFFVIYCSTHIPPSERLRIQEKLDALLKKMKLFHLDKPSISAALNPIFLYVLVPDLPKRYLLCLSLHLFLLIIFMQLEGINMFIQYVHYSLIGLNLFPYHHPQASLLLIDGCVRNLTRKER